MTEFHKRAVAVIKKVPKGRVATYGQIAILSGNNRGARQIARILHSSSRKENLPWHRIIGSRGTISLPPGEGFELQRAMLLSEKIDVGLNGSISLEKYQWCPRRISFST